MVSLGATRARVTHAVTWRARGARDAVARTAEIARTTRAEHGTGPVRTAARAAGLARRGGFTLEESFTMGLLDPSRAHEAADLVSKRRAIALQAGLNPYELRALTEDKVVFSRYTEALGLPVPRLLAILPQSGGGWAAGDPRPLPGREKWARYLAVDAPETFVVKPSRGYHGLGVRLVTRRPDGDLEVEGTGTTTAAALADALMRDRQFHVWIVQERLRNHPDLPGEGAALQTLRIITFVDGDGRAEAVNAQFRVTAPGSVVDNFANGATGNVLSIVDLHDGTLGGVIHADERRVMHQSPPGTVPWWPAPGARLPHWDGIVAAVTEAAAHFLPMRAIGWDVAVTTDGPRIVEANIWWDPPSPERGVGALMGRMRPD